MWLHEQYIFHNIDMEYGIITGVPLACLVLMPICSGSSCWSFKTQFLYYPEDMKKVQ